MTLLIAYAGTAVAFSFLCSILEASFLSARTVTLHERRDRGDKGAELLLRLKQEHVDDALAAILIFNTIANTAGATLAGAQAEKLFERPWVAVFTVGLILMILVVSEIVPKTLGAVYSGRLVTFTAYSVRALIGMVRRLGFLWLARLVTRTLARRKEPSISRGELVAMISMATRAGALPAEGSRLVSNVLQLEEIRVEDVMTPRTVVAMLPSSSTLDELLADEDCRVFSRIPLYEESPDDAKAYVLQREVLKAGVEGTPRTTPLSAFARPALLVPDSQTVDRALRTLTQKNEHLALVIDEYGGLAGLVSLEDLIETLLGIEILDESDRVPDLRSEAKKLRDQRLQHKHSAPS